METRRRFLASLIGVLSGIAAAVAARNPVTGAPASPTPARPSPAPSASPSPSALARELARSLQRDLAKAHLSDELTEKIAADIDGNLSITKSLGAVRLANWEEPDFVFSAAGSDEA